jgi:hypothetical protein
MRWEREGHTQPPRPDFVRARRVPKLGLLQIEYWDRSPEDRERKQAHLDALDDSAAGTGCTREDHILATTLLGAHVACEPNMFPYVTPPGVSHHTIWSRTFLEDAEVEVFIESWLFENKPGVTAWAFDPSNLSEGMSVDLYHVHVFFYEPPPRLSLPVSAKAPVLVDKSLCVSHRVECPPSPDPYDAEQRDADGGPVYFGHAAVP